ncbi:MAG TPA: aldehyde dehydrogenase family protein, partial [Candidatus Sulfotelmatobacter sp.]|nr:aldehyde dehydrogenase family protein [Candidatus Sulfotelmatobacter sp.]
TGRGVPLDAHPAGTGRLGFTLRVPIGVVAAITPFNFPLNLVAHKVGPAVAAGCRIVLKPSLKTPLSGLALAEILYGAGLPREWLSTVNGPPEEIVDVLLQDDRVAMITFTGSSQIGWSLVARAPRKHITLELGNATPLIVCADADLEAAATAAATSGFGFAGQSCISVQRILVHRSVHDRFLDRLAEAAEGQVVGDPRDPETTVGPVIDGSARDRIVEWVGEAESAGAVKRTGGPGDDGHLRPVVLDRVPTEVRAWKREVFGPVVAVRPYDDLDQAIALANGTEYGLQAGIYTRDLPTALSAVERLQFGGVTVNETPTFRVDQMPYGGTKESGNTREGPHYTVREMTEERMVVIRP